MRILHFSSGSGSTSIPFMWFKKQMETGVDVGFYGLADSGKGRVARCLHGLKFIKREEFDVLHVHHALPAALAVLSRWLFLSRKPFVISLHRSFHHLGPGAKVCHVLAFMVSKKIIANSLATKDTLPRIFKGKAEVVYNGTAVGFWSSPNVLDKKKSLNILFVGRFVKEKNIFSLVAALKSVSAIVAIKADFLGAGPLFNNVAKFIDEMNVSDCISVHGEVGRAEVAEFMSSADCLIVSSLTEGYCNVAVEAMSLGLPVIYTPAPALIEVVNGNGWCCSGFGSEDIAAQILSFHQEDGDRIKTRSEKAWSMVKREMSIDASIDRFSQIYQEVTSND